MDYMILGESIALLRCVGFLEFWWFMDFLMGKAVILVWFFTFDCFCDFWAKD